MENQPRIVSRQEVTKNLIGGLVQDQAEFKNSIAILKHGQKSRLLEAIASYPLTEVEFDEPELRTSYTVWKRISDSLVAVGTEAAIEGILNSLEPKKEGESDESAKKEE
jgi:hypothetical protein